MSRKKPVEHGTCEFCHQRFVKKRAWARFCPGTSCSDKARRKRAAHPIALLSMPEGSEVAAAIENSRKQREESDDYPEVVAVLNPTLRIIRSRCNIQWIAQKKSRPTRWESFAFCGTREGLFIRIRDYWQSSFHPKEHRILSLETLVALHCDCEAWGAIEALPDYFPKATQSPPPAVP